jgi:hypothetical protein
MWRRVGPQVVTGTDYTIGPRDVEITPLPAWIRTDLAGDVVRSLSMDAPLSILQDDLNQRIHDAFAAQPWVAKVQRVSKQHPARLRVDLVYRRPVCMVESASGVRPGSREAISLRLLPIDEQGVLLPERDFSDAQRRQYPRLSGIPTAPPGVAGSPWRDARVTGGALIAAALVEVWSEYSLDRIVASQTPDTTLDREEYTYTVFTTGGTRILWGHAPDTRFPGEVPVSEKLARLKQEKRNGSLNGANGPQTIDLSYWHHARVWPTENEPVTR